MTRFGLNAMPELVASSAADENLRPFDTGSVESEPSARSQRPDQDTESLR
jgi:hypothetical protein